MLTGPAIGRSKSATYRTADVVGLDTMAHVVKTMGDTLPADPWAAFYQAPEWLAQLIAKGALGSKTKAGVYTKKGNGHPRPRRREKRLPAERRRRSPRKSRRSSRRRIRASSSRS